LISLPTMAYEFGCSEALPDIPVTNC
jgi:hypothetical protein